MSGKKLGVLLGLLALAACGGVEGEEASAPSVQADSLDAACGWGRNLLRNPSFEKGEALPAYWQRDAFISQDGLFAWVKGKSFRGHRSVRVSIPEGMPNDARWIQTVPVEPHTRYRLSG